MGTKNYKNNDFFAIIFCEVGMGNINIYNTECSKGTETSVVFCCTTLHVTQMNVVTPAPVCFFESHPYYKL